MYMYSLSHPYTRKRKHGRSLTVMPWIKTDEFNGTQDTTDEFNVSPTTHFLGMMFGMTHFVIQNSISNYWHISITDIMLMIDISWQWLTYHDTDWHIMTMIDIPWQWMSYHVNYWYLSITDILSIIDISWQILIYDNVWHIPTMTDISCQSLTYHVNQRLIMSFSNTMSMIRLIMHAQLIVPFISIHYNFSIYRGCVWEMIWVIM